MPSLPLSSCLASQPPLTWQPARISGNRFRVASPVLPVQVYSRATLSKTASYSCMQRSQSMQKAFPSVVKSNPGPCLQPRAHKETCPPTATAAQPAMPLILGTKTKQWHCLSTCSSHGMQLKDIVLVMQTQTTALFFPSKKLFPLQNFLFLLVSMSHHF